MIRYETGQTPLNNFREMALQRGREQNLSILDLDRELDQVILPPSNGRSISPNEKIKSEKSYILEEIRFVPTRSVG